MHGRTLDLDALMSLPTIFWARVSPDRRHVAVNIHRLHPSVDVFDLPLESDGSLAALTDTPERTVLKNWAPDSRSVLVAEDKGGNERQTLYRVFLDEPGQLQPLTESEPDYYLRGGEFDPDGEVLIYAANYDFEGERELETFRVVVQEVETGRRDIIAAPEKRGNVYPGVSPDGRWVLYNRKDRHPAGTQYWIVGIDGADDREVLNFGDEADVSATWTYDGRVAFLTDSIDGVRQERGSVGLFDAGTDAIEWILRPSEDPRNVEAVWSPYPHEHLVLQERQEAQDRAFLRDLRSGEERRVAPSRGTLTPLGPLQRGEWAGLFYSSTNPIDVVAFRPSSGDPEDLRNLTDVLSLSAVQREDLTEAEEFRWTGSEGLALHGWLYRPAAHNGMTIVYVHGGPTAHSRDQLNPQIQYFCSRGFTVLDPNYRGSTGYGVRFRELIREEGWGGGEQEDIRAGIHALIGGDLARPGAVGITGTSYGGYSSWWAITHFSRDEVAAAAPVCGMTDLVVDYETTRPDLRPYSEEMMGGSPEEVPEKYRERSPIHFVQDIRGKLLIVQGQQDPNVTLANVREVEGRLRMAGIPYEKLVFDDEGHGILQVKNQKVLYPRLAAFFEKALAEGK
ncbi:MAG: prolyl oligopeptidase family serine peptidase [Thermoplasmata archaeon]